MPARALNVQPFTIGPFAVPPVPLLEFHPVDLEPDADDLRLERVDALDVDLPVGVVVAVLRGALEEAPRDDVDADAEVAMRPMPSTPSRVCAPRCAVTTTRSARSSATTGDAASPVASMARVSAAYAATRPRRAARAIASSSTRSARAVFTRRTGRSAAASQRSSITF
jgi:hypothetical protein